MSKVKIRSKILGVGSYVPPQCITNFDLEEMLDTSNKWIVPRTGIKQRYWVKDGEDSNAEMAMKASLQAIENAGITKNDLDMIIYATLSPDHEFPGTACFLQGLMDIPEIPVLDIRQQCSGFIYAMSIADMYIRNGVYKNILIVGSEIHSRGLEKTPRGRDVSVLFGDGAGACVLSATEVNDPAKDSHLMSTHLHADGKYAKELWVPAPGSGFKTPERLEMSMIEEGLHYPAMNGKKVFVHAVKRMGEVLLECLQHNKVPSIDDIDLVLFHQANLRINEAVSERFKIPAEKVFNTIDRFANTTAATIPIGMAEAIKAGKLKPGMLVAISVFGSGFTWGAALLRF